MLQPAAQLRSRRRYILLVLLCILAVYVVVPQLGGLRSSWHLLSQPSPGWLGLAIALTFATYLAAAGTYFLLAFKPLHYGQLVLVQLAAMFVNKLLPAGLGAVGANYAYLRQRRHSLAQSAATVAANNLIGITGHLMVLVFALLAFSGTGLDNFWHPPYRLSLAMGVFLVSLLLVGLVVGSGSFLTKTRRSLWRQFVRYKTRPGRLLAALATSISLTLCNVLCLASCALALGMNLSFMAVLLVFSLGAVAATATPTPGGLGGFEAGLFAGFVAYHVTAPAALALALLYRLVSYWLPLVAGMAAFVACQKRQLFMT